MKLTIIVAVAQNNVIGRGNSLPWHLSADMKRFKELTTGHTVLMGRNTYESIGRPLPNRRNVVLSRTLDHDAIEGCEVYSGLDEFLQKGCLADEHVYVIGGGHLYREVMNRKLAETLRLTYVHCSPFGDTFFPEIDEKEWKEVYREKHNANDKNDFDYDFVDYERRV